MPRRQHCLHFPEIGVVSEEFCKVLIVGHLIEPPHIVIYLGSYDVVVGEFIDDAFAEPGRMG